MIDGWQNLIWNHTTRPGWSSAACTSGEFKINIQKQREKTDLCSRDGRPTKENPFPTELLGEVGKEAPCYRGRRPEEEGGRERTAQELARSIATTICGDMVNLVMVAVDTRIERIEERREAEEERMRERDEQRRRDIQAHRNVTYRQLFPLVRSLK